MVDQDFARRQADRQAGRVHIENPQLRQLETFYEAYLHLERVPVVHDVATLS